MKRTIVSPWRFVVGPDILPEIGLHGKWLGKKAFLLGGQRALDAVKEPILASLSDNGIQCHIEHGSHVDKVKDVETRAAEVPHTETKPEDVSDEEIDEWARGDG